VSIDTWTLLVAAPWAVGVIGLYAFVAYDIFGGKR
jgi:hypothetical protein